MEVLVVKELFHSVLGDTMDIKERKSNNRRKGLVDGSFFVYQIAAWKCTTQRTGGVARFAGRSLRQAPTTSNTARTAADVSPADRQPSA